MAGARAVWAPSNTSAHPSPPHFLLFATSRTTGWQTPKSLLTVTVLPTKPRKLEHLSFPFFPS